LIHHLHEFIVALASPLIAMPRSAWKGPFFVQFSQVAKATKMKPTARAMLPPIRTNARSCTILPHFIGLKFEVHNGKTYIPITVAKEMVGHKLGEFARTRELFKYRDTLPRPLPVQYMNEQQKKAAQQQRGRAPSNQDSKTR
jgi:ribosomal protein S19